MKIFLICPQADQQSGVYLHDTLIEMGHEVAFIDQRKAAAELGGVRQMHLAVETILRELKPELTIIIKAGEFDTLSIQRFREAHPHRIVAWMFDVTFNGKLVEEIPPYVQMLKEFDIFYTIDRDAVPGLQKQGVNAKWLSEACFIPDHKEVVFNSIQKKKYGAEVVFLGSVGGIHPNRTKLLQRIHAEGIPLKLYGQVLFPENTEPDWVKDCHTGFEATNDYHSIVSKASTICLGIDGWPERDGSWSARLYRTMCSGGFYLTTHTKGIEDMFTPGKHLAVYDNEDDMIEKILHYLSNDEEREKVALEGQKLVMEKHTFTQRFEQMLKDVQEL